MVLVNILYGCCQLRTLAQAHSHRVLKHLRAITPRVDLWVDVTTAYAVFGSGQITGQINLSDEGSTIIESAL